MTTEAEGQTDAGRRRRRGEETMGLVGGRGRRTVEAAGSAVAAGRVGQWGQLPDEPIEEERGRE